jgi:hypothetical protein
MYILFSASLMFNHNPKSIVFSRHNHDHVPSCTGYRFNNNSYKARRAAFTGPLLSNIAHSGFTNSHWMMLIAMVLAMKLPLAVWRPSLVPPPNFHSFGLPTQRL